MVLKRVDTQSNLKKWYNTNTKTRENVAETLQSHLSFEEFVRECTDYFIWQVVYRIACHITNIQKVFVFLLPYRTSDCKNDGVEWKWH